MRWYRHFVSGSALCVWQLRPRRGGSPLPSNKLPETCERRDERSAYVHSRVRLPRNRNSSACHVQEATARVSSACCVSGHKCSSLPVRASRFVVSMVLPHQTTRQELRRKELTIVDDSDAAVTITLWEDLAGALSDAALSARPLLAIKGTCLLDSPRTSVNPFAEALFERELLYVFKYNTCHHLVSHRAHRTDRASIEQ